MRCFIEKSAFVAFRKALDVADPNAEEDQPADWCLVRLEAADGMLRARSIVVDTEVPARVERPGVVFTRLMLFLYSTEPLHYLPDPGDEIEIDASPEELNTSYLPVLHGDADYAYFPDPATAPATWEYTPEPEEADLADAE